MWLLSVKNVAVTGGFYMESWGKLVLADLAIECKVGRDVTVGLRIEIQGYLLKALPCLLG